MENEDKAMELNVAYGTSTDHQTEDNVYDDPQILDQRHDELTKDKKIVKKRKSILLITGCALGLSILALLVAAIATVAIYLGTSGTQSDNFSSQDYLPNISTLNKRIQALQTELYKLSATITALTNILTRSKGTFWSPARSCINILESPSGDYWIQTNKTSNPVQVYCDMNRASCSCNSTGVWMRVANLDMTDPCQNCPAGFRLVNRTVAPLRTCGRPGPAGCVSTTFQTYGVEYSHVCGKVIGYQDQTPDAFSSSNRHSVYVDGVSLTHGQSPRNHIWTFAGAVDEIGSNEQSICPCTRSDVPYTGPMVPSFVGQDYFCDILVVEGIISMVFSMLMIHSGMVRDVEIPALAVSLTIHHGSASNSHSQLLMISS